MIKCKFKVGDKVRVVDNSKICTDTRLAHEAGLRSFRYLGIPNHKIPYKIVMLVQLRAYPSTAIYAIEGVNGGQYLIEEEGIELWANKTPRPHADLIKQWADDDSLEVQLEVNGEWIGVPRPVWDSESQYRIKPKKSPQEIEKEEILEEMKKLEERLSKLEVKNEN